jgi:protein tyrosine phosphatase (PTP) superfamily phosphohydrolase (DUF442 family)
MRYSTGLSLGLALFSVSLLALSSCAGPGPDQDVPAPIQVTSSAYEAAAVSQLPEQAPIEYPGLHHLFWLSDDILSGAEPEGDVALEKLAEMGIKTILSVDGKAPDAETAKKLGMRYVHVPIRYRGIEQDELLKIAKTFRELEGPFYVHCYHGVHRGPAAAAVGRVVLDGAPREQAIAEMRQYCGTSSKYEGLYGAIAFGQLPSAEETQAYPFGFEAQHQFRGFRHAMVDLARSWDLIKALSKRDWQPDPSHPDASARNEAAKMVDMFAAMTKMQTEIAGYAQPDEFEKWLID